MSHKSNPVVLFRLLMACVLVAGLLQSTAGPAIAATQIDIHGPSGSGSFGSWTVLLPNGNIVVTDPDYDRSGVLDVGAAYLVNGASGALISTLTGVTANDRVGSGGITILDNGNYVVQSPRWSNGAGAVTWGSQVSGVSGQVSALNSLVGGTADDQVGLGGYVVNLSSGNYVVCSPSWDNGAAANAGAVTWGNGAGGTVGVISASNSLVGSTTEDWVAASDPCITVLTNGSYVVNSPQWDNGAVVDAGAVTWGSGAGGVAGVISAANSLVGSTADDRIGFNGVAALTNGDYVVSSYGWDSGATPNVGAVTWGSGTAGVKGAVSALNSLVGGSAGDNVGGYGVEVLNSGAYVVRSPEWDNSGATEAGAVTWGNGTGGTVGVVSALNSLVGSSTDDNVGYEELVLLSDGDYVVRSPGWDDGAWTEAGAVTWGSRTAGVKGAISASNSLVGGNFSQDKIGSGGLNSPGVVPLSNGNYVVVSPEWDDSGVFNGGAVTWADGDGGTVGVVTALNSLVGSKSSDTVGINGAIALSDGDYVVRSSQWDNGGGTNAGAVTWGNGDGGTVGPVTPSNSLVGDKTDDYVGLGGNSVIELSNGNYVVCSWEWGNGAATNAGAVTWANGGGGTVGVVSAANSLVGSTADDKVGWGYAIPLSNGNYVVQSPAWDDGGITDAGAATWGNGAGGTAGVVSAANSLVGSTAGDQVGVSVIPLSNGNYVVRSYLWDNGALPNAGAVTWGNGNSGTAGPVSSTNSLVGSTDTDVVGQPGVTALSNGNYVVISSYWDNGTAWNAGAVTLGNGAGGTAGAVSASNSLVGSTSADNLGVDGVILLGGSSFLVHSSKWDNGTLADAGAVTWGNGTSSLTGLVTSANSLVGSAAGDGVGSQDAVLLSNGSFMLRSPLWDNGALADAGAVTWSMGTGGVFGPIIYDNSVRGALAGSGAAMYGQYDPVNNQLVVTRRSENIVTLFNTSTHNVAVTPPTSAKTGAPGAAVSYTLQVQNTGDVSETFNVAVSGGAWTTSAPATIGPIAAGASQDLAVSVAVPAGAGGGDSDAATVTVSSTVVPSKTDSAVLTTTAANVYGVTVTPAADAKTGAPGATVSYSLQITNTGNIAASFNLAVSGAAWTTSLPASIGPIAVGASQSVTASVTVPASALGGSKDTATITVRSQADNTKTDSAVLTTTAANVYGVTVTPATDAKTGAPGAAVSYSLQVVNTGNVAASFNLAVSGAAWVTGLPASIGPLAPGAGQSVTVSVTIPAGAAGGSKDTATITVTSQVDNTKTDSAVLTTSVTAPPVKKIYMPLVKK